MKKLFIILLVCFATLHLCANDILKKADEYRNYSDNGFSFKYTLIEGKSETIMDAYVKSGESNSVLIAFRSPKKIAKRRVFVNDSAFWMYDSKMNSPVRISAQQMLTGEAGAGDITNIIFSKIYDVESVFESGTLLCLKLQIKNNANGNYPKADLYVDVNTYKPQKAVFYSSTNTLLKTVNYTDFSLIDGKELITGLEIINELNKSKSVVLLSEFNYLNLSDNYFSKEGMKLLK